MNGAFEGREVAGDLFGGVIGLDVVVAGVEHDDPRLVRNHDALGIPRRVGRQRAAESAVDRPPPELGKRLRQVPADDTRGADEDDGVLWRRRQLVGVLELPDRRFPAIRVVPIGGSSLRC